MEKYPKYRDTVSIYTATCEIKHGVYPRYFEIRSAEGELLGTAMTLWVVFDLNKRAMVSEAESGIMLESGLAHESIPKLPMNPKPLKDGSVRLSEHTAVYSDLDMIGHVNNTHYIDWLCNAVPYEKYRTAFMSRVLIGYAEETAPDTTLTLEYCENGNAFSFCDRSEGKHHFVICGEWQEL